MNVSKGQRVVPVAMAVAVALGASMTFAHANTQAAGTSPAPAAQAAVAGDTAAADAKAAETFKTKCSVCHAVDGNSPLPNMSFTDGVWKHGTTVKEMVTTISNGVPGTAMMPFKTQFTPEEIEALARHVRKFDKKLK